MLSISDKKIYYSITTLSFIKINCGYVDFNNSSIKIMYANDKIKFLSLNDVMPNSQNINVFKHVSCLKISSAILLGEDAEEYKYYLCALINCLNPVIFAVLSQVEPYLKYKNDVIMLGEESSSGALAEIDYSTNFISIIIIAVSKIINNINKNRRSKNVKRKG